MNRLGRGFFERYSPTVARDLIGCSLVRDFEGDRLSGIIVETEAYRGTKDPASHAFRGKTRRNEVMFGPSGHAYVYFTMGMHHCINVTTEGPAFPGAVLLRALEPQTGLVQMKKNRRVRDPVRVASGPGNLTKALGIGIMFNGEDLVTSRVLFIEERKTGFEVGTSARVGISKGTSFRWRFFAKGSAYVSRGKPST